MHKGWHVGWHWMLRISVCVYRRVFHPVSPSGVGRDRGAAAGYDATVTTVRWTFSGTLSFSPPANAGTVTYTVGVP